MQTAASIRQFALINVLPPAAASYAEALYYAVEEKFRLTGRTTIPWPPHVTLKYHFRTDDIAPVEAVLAEFAQAESPVPWAIDGFNAFTKSDARVIFLEVCPNAAVRAFHDRLWARLRTFEWMAWGFYDGPELHYHATIAHRGLTPENFDAVWQFVNSREIPRFDLLLDNVTLVEIKEDGEAVTVRQHFDLTGASA